MTSVAEAGLPHDRYCDEVVVQAGLLGDLLRDADMSLPVPTCPGWTLDDLARHVLGNLVTLEAAVRDVDPPMIDTASDVRPMLTDAATGFAATLRAAGPSRSAEFGSFTMPTAFWVRRATHDLVIHRADAAAATEADYRVDPELAVDAVDELLENVAPARPEHEPVIDQLQGPERSIHLHAIDADDLAAEWYVESGQDGLSWRRSHERAAVALRGPLTDVLTVFYRRQPVAASPVEVVGERTLLDLWLRRVDMG